MTQMLIELGLGAIPDLGSDGRTTLRVRNLIADQRAALDFVFAFIKDERPLTLSYIKELHQLLTRNQETRDATDFRGHRFHAPLTHWDWKKLSNNPIRPDGLLHQYCPPEFVQDEMDELVRLHRQHEAQGIRAEVEAAWLHHRFTQIHPFEDGNGRVARALATMVFLKARLLPLVIRDEEDRERYLDALEQGDTGDLGSLINLFANIQARDLEDAVTFVREMRGPGLKEIALSAADAAKRRLQSEEGALSSIADHLAALAQSRLSEVASELRREFTASGLDLDAFVGTSDAVNDDWWYHQIVGAARRYNYLVDLAKPRRWVQLRLGIPALDVPDWHIVVSFHHKESRASLMAIVVILTNTEFSIEEPRPVILGHDDHEFTFSGKVAPDEGAFQTWLEHGVTNVLEKWQARL